MKDSPIADYSLLVIPSGTQLKDFLLPHKSEILFVLKAIVKQQTPVMAYYEKQKQFFESRLIEANSKENRFQMFATSNKDTNKSIQQNKAFMCVSYHDSVKVQFLVEHAKLISQQKNSILMSKLPTKMYKVQRREYFRLSLEQGFSVTCSIPIKNIKRIDLNIYDLSLGGLSLVLPDEYAETFSKNEIVKGCTINLPGMGMLIVDLQMRGSFTTVQPDLSILRRMGCQFANIHPMMEDILQRFITVVDRNRIAQEISKKQNNL